MTSYMCHLQNTTYQKACFNITGDIAIVKNNTSDFALLCLVKWITAVKTHFYTSKENVC